MKRKYLHPEPTHRELSGPKYWKSLDEVTQTPVFREWLEREFPDGASQLDEVDRRHFLKIMGASFAFAGVGLAGCRQPEQHILPYAKQPERLIPGVPVFYTTAQAFNGEYIPLIVETHQARPTKIEGNPSYQPYGGATTTFAQASVLDLYDPDRSMYSQQTGGAQLKKSDVFDLLSQIANRYQSSAGKGLVFIDEPSASPTKNRLIKAIRQRYPQALWINHNSIDPYKNQQALKTLCGRSLRPIYDFKRADRILALESNFLQFEPGSLAYTRDFTARRKTQTAQDVSGMNRLYAVESTLTLTGGMADHRLRLAFSHLPAFTAAIAAEVLKQIGAPLDEILSLEALSTGLNVDGGWIKACAQDLVEHSGRALVVVGQDAPASVHQLAARINLALQAPGSTLKYIEGESFESHSWHDLHSAIQQKSVQTIIILDGNPAYTAPHVLDWDHLKQQVPEVIRLGYYQDETSAAAHTHIARTHYLESWGDGRTWDGTIVSVQPMILPLFEGLSELEVLARLLGLTKVDAYGLVRETFDGLSLPNKLSFDGFLAQGVLVGSGYDQVDCSFTHQDLLRELNSHSFLPPSLHADSLEVRLLPSTQVWDGRYANNGWLQECPEPMTKLTWDNVILVGPQLAKELSQTSQVQLIPDLSILNEQGQTRAQFNHFKRGAEEAFIGELSVQGQKIVGPIHVHPGLADYTIALTLGYGRTKAGRVGDRVGFSVASLSQASTPMYVNASLKPTEQTYRLANTQSHWSMEGRAIVREANVAEYAAHPDFVEHMCIESHAPANLGPDAKKPFTEVVRDIPRGNSAYETPPFKAPQQWGMVIDLSSCTGCNACVIACQSENNVPIVGKDQVSRGREMHWLRMDRYFSSGQETTQLPDDPQVSFMAMMCQHCEMAPCETVCPVNATVHDDQGLNVMAYNRCVGTRYCANNCPYKVRRFNFFDWNKREIGRFYEGPMGPSGMPELHQMQKNPNVTVRMRGVMEKCTYCVQRIEAAKIRQLSIAKDSDNILVPDGVIKTACQQVCPSESIVFGDVADSRTAVSQARSSDRAYAVLGYLNIRPRTFYLARLRNPNPNMPDYATQPLSRLEYESRYGHATHAHNVAS